jgi:two-component system, LytTR family, sensor histidine kinase AlgZ
MIWIMARGWTIRLIKLSAFTAVVTAVSMIVMLLLRAALPWPTIGEYVGIFVVHAFIISALCWMALPGIGKWSGSRPWQFRWMIIVAVLLGLGVAGTAMASITIHYTLRSAARVPFWIFFSEALRAAIPVTLVAGVITTVIAAGRSRLESSELAIQEQRLRRETAEKLAAEARLASLTSRVQPHFLFNTLNSIAGLIRENPAEAEQTVERLASLLRSSLENIETIPIDQEMKLVRDYLEIQKTRMRDRLIFNVIVDADIRAAVPPFSVQTLVENSVKHASGQLPGGLRLEVRVTRYDNDVVVYVTDNGSGFDPRFMKAGHGLDILQARLRAVHGESGRLDFFGEPGRMTVQLRVPYDESIPG